MKSEGAVRHKLKQVRYRHMKQAIEVGLTPSCTSCRHMKRLIRGRIESVACLRLLDSNGIVIDLMQPSDLGFMECGGESFISLQDKEDIKTSFATELATMRLPDIAARYPDMAALMWVLGISEAPDEEADLDETDAPDISPEVTEEKLEVEPPPDEPVEKEFPLEKDADPLPEEVDPPEDFDLFEASNEIPPGDEPKGSWISRLVGKKV